jgi:hypothetical protein
MDNREKAVTLIKEILEEVTGGLEADEDFDLGDLEMGFEDLVACTEVAFGLPEDWTGDGSEVNESLKVYVDFVCSLWDGETLNEDWRSASELLGGG